ncbi:lysophospholipid acyltransferase family protein [Flavobacterium sp.]|uniref:lysophospholipid acyltransferase family protein n=1 Tax=Flavobacterium sp. TaxID=239 RepID=UPI0037511B6D
MQLLIYLLFYPILWLISILPFRLLYLFSDGVYLLVYYIIGYRKKTVRNNLAIALPHLSDKERLVIEKKFYSHMCDMFLEMIKTITISQSEIDKRYKFTNLEVYLDLEKKQKSIALMCAHYASYEWAISMNNHINFTGYGIYKKIANKYFDKLVKDIRSKFKAVLITTKETSKTIQENAISGKLGIFGFASDQTPRWSDNLHWYHFMGIETPIHVGAEILAKKYNMNVIFLKTKKVKRGYYEASLEVLSDDIQNVPNYKISEEFMNLVEQQIYEQPEYYLWTHKRWKHKKKV